MTELLFQGAVIVLSIALTALLREPDEIDDRWTRADLSKVPPVITQPEPRGHVLPWYRRVLRRAPPSEEAPRALTTYRD